MAASADACEVVRMPQPVAYFTMEIALDARMHTYSGGLGVLAGDAVRAAADAGLPMAAVTLLHRDGYFRQRLDARGRQSDAPDRWRPETLLEVVDARVEVELEGLPVRLGAWRYRVQGVDGHEVPVYFLDADVEGNAPRHRRLARRLYGGDDKYRLMQEAILGLGGVALLDALGVEPAAYHMNEGHSALLTLALVERARRRHAGDGVAVLDDVRARCVFTTHTPVPEGHDRFPMRLVERVLGAGRAGLIDRDACCDGTDLNMTLLALHHARYANAVSQRHRLVSQRMFPRHAIDGITNGAHAATWTAPPWRRLFDGAIPGWRRDNRRLHQALDLDPDAARAAHAEAKEDLAALVRDRVGGPWDPEAFTLGFARRATSYKRADLLLSDPDRLAAAARKWGPIQVLYAGKSHPRDTAGQEGIQRVVRAARKLPKSVRVVWVPGYDVDAALTMVAGVDVWLNTPERPLEASGTSGMKAAFNGVPSLSVLDGWWVEGALEGVTGWTIEGEGPPDAKAEARSLYAKLTKAILPLWHRDPDGWTDVMRATIALNGSHFTAQRMMEDYAGRAYAPAAAPRRARETAQARSA